MTFSVYPRYVLPSRLRPSSLGQMRAQWVARALYARLRCSEELFFLVVAHAAPEDLLGIGIEPVWNRVPLCCAVIAEKDMERFRGRVQAIDDENHFGCWVIQCTPLISEAVRLAAE